MNIVNRQPEKTADVSSNRHEMWPEFRKLIISATVLIIVVYFSIGFIVDACIPFISAEKEAAMFSGWNIEKNMSKQNDEKLKRANEILIKLTADPSVPALPFRLILLDKEVPNAFAFPGGTIGVTEGLLNQLDEEIALAFVLGHELGHFQQRDHLRGLGRAIGGSIAFAIVFGGDMGGNQFGKTFTHVLNQSYSRTQEESADEFGLRLVYRVYGGTESCDKLFNILQETDKTPEWAYMLSTHPSPKKRIEQLQREAELLNH